MNISKVARQALIPIERKIKGAQVEYGFTVTNIGELFGANSGNGSAVNMPHNSISVKNLIFTHNHPSTGPLSRPDILSGIKYKCRELRAVTSNELCHLVEIPKMGLIKKNKMSFRFIKI